MAAMAAWLLSAPGSGCLLSGAAAASGLFAPALAPPPHVKAISAAFSFFAFFASAAFFAQCVRSSSPRDPAGAQKSSRCGAGRVGWIERGAGGLAGPKLRLSRFSFP